MIAARRRERDYFASTPEYKHLASRMGSEHLAKMLSKVLIEPIFFSLYFPLCFSDEFMVNLFLLKHLETVIKSRIPSLQSLISKTINELEIELSRLGKPVATDAGVSLISL